MREVRAPLIAVAICAFFGCHRDTRLTVQGNPCAGPADCQEPYVCDLGTRTCQFALRGADAASVDDALDSAATGDAAMDAAVGSGDVGGIGDEVDAAAPASDTSVVPGSDASVVPGSDASVVPGSDASVAPGTCKPDAAAESCPPDYATCGGSSCGVFLLADQHNCGECGHSCGDAICQDGQCEPILMFATQ